MLQSFMVCLAGKVSFQNFCFKDAPVFHTKAKAYCVLYANDKTAK